VRRLPKAMPRAKRRKQVAARPGTEHVRLKVRRVGSEEISIFGPGPEGTEQPDPDQQAKQQDVQTYASRKEAVLADQSQRLSKGPGQPQAG
jgi:hypothetical protein